jgi:N-acetylglucosaminyldiphosphoundecaprenol N-acetyl-beta-D-mannosaminyltransferase
VTKQRPTGRVSFLDVNFDLVNRSAVLRAIDDLITAPVFTYIVTPNVDHLVTLHANRTDGRLWESYERATFCLCDSKVLQALAKSSGIQLELVTGSDLTGTLLDYSVHNLECIAVIGGDSELLARLISSYPKWTWYQHIPPMGVRSDRAAQDAIIAFVEGSRADLFFFAIGAPQSELLCAEIADRGHAKGVALCIGASLEFVTRLKKRAPRWMRAAGVEWLFRLASEPRRLWRRYLLVGPSIFAIWWRWEFRTRRAARFDSNPSDDSSRS